MQKKIILRALMINLTSNIITKKVSRWQFIKQPSVIGAGPKQWKAASSQSQCIRPLGYRGSPSAGRDSEQSASMH